MMEDYKYKLSIIGKTLGMLLLIVGCSYNSMVCLFGGALIVHAS